MELPLNLRAIAEEQYQRVISFKNETVTKCAESVAFWLAMRVAALEDPMDDELEQAELLALIEASLDENLMEYMDAVNDLM